MAQLRAAVEQRKARIIRDLIEVGYTKYEDGRQLYELPLADLERLNIDMRIKKCRPIKIKQVK
jgi:hypothetical protein